jgi:hypothetical protein
MPTPRDRLLTLAAQYADIARCLTVAAEVLATDGATKAVVTFPAKMRKALRGEVVDAETTTPPPRPTKKYALSVRVRREQSAAWLATFDREEPRSAAPTHVKHIGVFVRRGYLRRKGTGYVRTAKAYVP